MPPASTIRLVGNDQLLKRAQRAQLRARAAPAVPRDWALVYVNEEARPETHTNGIREMSRKQQKTVQDVLRDSFKCKKTNGEGRDEFEIRRVRGGQQSDCMTEFETDGMQAGCYLPGGAPLVDHIRARLEHMPDWRCLVPAVERLRNHRLPDLDRPASQREFTLGETSEEHVQAAVEYLKANVQLTKNRFMVCRLAADTESIGLVSGDHSKLFEGNLEEKYTLRVANDGESADALPVVLMVGHVGWQVHVRIPLAPTQDASGRKVLTLAPGKLQKGFTSFLKAMGSVTGVGVRKDLQEFVDLVDRLYGVDLWHRVKPPIELEEIMRRAGCETNRTGVEFVNWICFGTILAKGRVSKGDSNWDAPWDLLRVSSRGYLAGDISQPAGAAAMFTYIWLLRVFPDACAVRQLSVLDPPDLVRWWDKGAIAYLDPEEAKVNCNPGDSEMTKKVYREAIRSAESHCEVRDMEPKWPSITAGGARFTHAARAFLISKLEVLNYADGRSWPSNAPETVHMAMFSRDQMIDLPVPTDPIHGPGWAANPGLESQTLSEAEFVNWTAIHRLTGHGVSIKGLLLEYVRMAPQEGRSLLERLEAHTKAATTVFGCLEKAQKVVPVIRVMLSAFDLLPPRPEGWVDIYHEAEATTARVARVTAVASSRSARALGKALNTLSQHEVLKKAVKSATRHPPTTVDRAWPLMRLVAPIRSSSTRMTPQMVATIGRPTLPSTRKRDDPTGETAPKRARAVRPSDINPGDPMELLRFVVRADRVMSDTREADTASTGASHLEGIAGSPRATPYVHPQQGGASRVPVSRAQPTGVFLVGGSHAVNANLGLVGSKLDAPTKTIPITDWVPEAIDEAIAKLRRYDLRGGTVILWLLDEMVFEQQETGDPLHRSTYDGRLHCVGPLDVANWRCMASLMDECRPLLHACREAEAIILMSPLPMYLVHPCCEVSDHCLGHYNDERRRYICREVAGLHQAMVRWLSWVDQPNVFVACPHQELWATARILGMESMMFLLNSYTYDGVHLRSEAYRDLFDRLAIVLAREPGQFRPPMAQMADPESAPVRAPRSRRPVRERLGRTGSSQLPHGIEALVESFRDDEAPAVYSAESERAATRVAWRPRSRSRSLSPPISPGFWGSVRATAPRVDRRLGGRPG